MNSTPDSRSSLWARWSIALLFALSSGQLVADVIPLERPEWLEFFEKHQASGTLVVVDERKSPPSSFVVNAERARRRLAPASTFKIPHTLFALDAGVVMDEFQVIPWDGTTRSFPDHNQDQTLRSAMIHSTLWVYQAFALRIGEAKARTYLQKIGYGNADPTGPGDAYWVDGNLKISATEQIHFLRRLYRNTLPFKVAHQRLVKDLMIREAEPGWILRAKTGWEGRYGWWVGWVDTPHGAVFFASHIDTPRRMDDLPKRELIVRDVLRTMGLLHPG